MGHRPVRVGIEHILAAHDVDGDGYLDRLIVAAPWVCDRSIRADDAAARLLDRVASSLETVRAGRLGVVPLELDFEGTADTMLVGPATVWKTHTPYQLTRRAKRGDDAAEILRASIRIECTRRGLPAAEIDVQDYAAAGAGFLAASLVLRFKTAVEGPILLGRDSHQGGGLFLAKV